MEHIKVLKRAWNITWRYRALWLFGFLFALAGGGGGGNGGSGGGGSSGSGSNGGGTGPVPPFELPPFNPDPATIALIVVALLAVVLVLVIGLTILRYVAETAMIAGVDEIEGTEAKFTVRRGFQLGWSRQAFRLFLVNLAIGVPIFIGVIVLMALAASPLLLLLLKVKVVSIIAGILTAGLVLLAILVIIAVALIVSLVMPYVSRRVVLGKQGVIESIRQGVKLVRASLADTGLMWLLLAAVKIAWAIVMIPILVVTVLLALGIGGVPGGVVYLVSRSWIATAIVGGSLFLLTLIPAIAFVQGLFQVYLSTTWTLAYREVVARRGDSALGSDLVPISA